MSPIQSRTNTIFWMFFILQKLTELCRFATYLWDDISTIVINVQAKSCCNALTSNLLNIHVTDLILFYVISSLICDFTDKHEGDSEDEALILGLPRAYVIIFIILGIVTLAVIILVASISLVIYFAVQPSTFCNRRRCFCCCYILEVTEK